MDKKFSRLYQAATRPENILSLNLKQDRFVIFSDHHKGDGSAADDFKKNAKLYEASLSYYQEQRYKLIVLGDVEELWENSYQQVCSQYKTVISQEILMAPKGADQKRIRIWGNHDKEVSLRRFKRTAQRFKTDILNRIEHRESLCLGEDIFLVHGHQGRFFDDKAWRISRWAVQFVWKTIQKIFRIGIDGPAENVELRDDLEMKYYRWANKHRVLLICGHTHQAIFASLTQYDRLQMDIARLQKSIENAPSKNQDKIKEEIETKKLEINKTLSLRLGKPPKSFEKQASQSIPCYFNSGCCGYTNGITCIEIDRGTIRLIKWQRHNTERIILVEDNLQLILKHIKAGKPLHHE